MNGMPSPGDTVATILPVNPEFLADVDDAEQHVNRMAAEAMDRCCAEHGLIAVDQRMTWQGTVAEARLRGDAPNWPCELPADTLLYYFRATAANP